LYSCVVVFAIGEVVNGDKAASANGVVFVTDSQRLISRAGNSSLVLRVPKGHHCVDLGHRALGGNGTKLVLATSSVFQFYLKGNDKVTHL